GAAIGAVAAGNSRTRFSARPDGISGPADGGVVCPGEWSMIVMTDPATGKAPKKISPRPPAADSAPEPAPPIEEQELVQRARRGHLPAYDDLVRRYQERIYATVYHMTSNHEDANDLAQEAFIKAFQALKTFKGGSSFYTWVYRIAVNKTINFLKQRKN